jgi:hypothetical protein
VWCSLVVADVLKASVVTSGNKKAKAAKSENVEVAGTTSAKQGVSLAPEEPVTPDPVVSKAPSKAERKAARMAAKAAKAEAAKILALNTEWNSGPVDVKADDWMFPESSSPSAGTATTIRDEWLVVKPSISTPKSKKGKKKKSAAGMSTPPSKQSSTAGTTSEKRIRFAKKNFGVDYEDTVKMLHTPRKVKPVCV